MAYELNNNSGIFFHNKDKKAGKHPNFKGQINVEGKVFDLAVWTRESKAGNEYFSVSISEPYKKEEHQDEFPLPEKVQVKAEKAVAESIEEPTDDLPF